MGLVKFLSICLVLSTASHINAFEFPQRSDEEPLKWWQEDVVYQIYPRSHQDSNGDGVGDLTGIERKLDHFVQIGVGSVWISPIYKSPMVDFGYDISNFTDIDARFGTMEDFQILASSMKTRGIELIMDFVPNHSSDQHEWFQKSVIREEPYTNFYVWHDGRQEGGNRLPPNNWLSVFGGSAWTWHPTRMQYYLHQFTKEQPDLNFNNRDVIIQMRAVLQFWLEKGVDGFRMDAVPHMFEDPSFEDEPVNTTPPPGAQCAPLFDYACLDHTKTYNLPQVLDVLAEFRQHIDTFSVNSHERVMMVEATIPTLDELFKYYGNSTRRIAHYPFNFEFINRIPKDFKGNHIADLIEEWYTKMPEGNTANWLLGNHDNSRVATRFGPELVDALNMINLLLPGSAVTYYGEEIGMTDAFISWEDTVDPPGCAAGRERYQEFSRDPERTPMQWDDSANAGFSTVQAPGKTWLPVHPDYLSVNVANQLVSTLPSHLRVYKAITDLRKSDVWRYGSMESISFDEDNLFGFTRIYKDNGFLVLANFGDETRDANATASFKNVAPRANVYLTSVNILPGTTIGTEVFTNQLRLGAKQAIILSFKVDYVPPEMSTEGEIVSTTEAGGAGWEPTTDAATANFVGTTCLLISLLFSTIARL